MLFQAVLFTVIAYLVACYAYGLFLLWKLYTGRKFRDDGGQGEHPVAVRVEAQPANPPAPASAYETAGTSGTAAKAA
ncbi:MAG: hypothetical protein AAF333_06080 [Planctomycetota bacterium]